MQSVLLYLFCMSHLNPLKYADQPEAREMLQNRCFTCAALGFPFANLSLLGTGHLLGNHCAGAKEKPRFSAGFVVFSLKIFEKWC